MIEDNHTKTIVALSTATGGALCVVRLSGERALEIVGAHFNRELKARVATFGTFRGADGEAIDEVVVTYFAAPRSFTGEDMVEISCHGSSWIASEIVAQCISSGAVAAAGGEFSKRAFLAGKMDLSQTEAIADLIASDSAASARLALQQMRGGYSDEFKVLRGELLNVLSLLELELDFGEEDVEFADRGQLLSIIDKIEQKVQSLKDSFRLGNVLKNGVPVAIVGAPNVGKSTLLNRLVGERRAIVSDIAGTTRDFIEAEITLGGVVFRFIDTAGLRESDCEVEKEGIERSREQLRKAAVVLHMCVEESEILTREALELTPDQKLLTVVNKIDLTSSAPKESTVDLLYISAKEGLGISDLTSALLSTVDLTTLTTDQAIVSNMRHYNALESAAAAFALSRNALESALPAELISAELRTALSSLQEITGEITTTAILGNIFENFCIGK